MEDYSDVIVDIQRREERTHVGRQNAEQRHATQNVDEDDAL